MSSQRFSKILTKAGAILSTALAKLASCCKSSLQQGILQPIVYGIIGAFCLAAMGIAFYYIGKYELLKNSSAPALDIIGLAVVFSLITVALLMASLRINLAWKVTLPKAVEFTSAMRRLGLFDFDTQLAFVSAQKMRVFIAEAPILHDVQENVRARNYMFLAHKDVLSSHKGKGTLCLDAEEYERVAQDAQTPFSILESAVVAGKETEIAALQKELLRKTSELERFSAENALLQDECAALKGKEHTAPGRNKKNDNFHASRAPFWLVAVPLIQRLRREAATDTEYTKDEIQAAFERELEDYPAFKPAITGILATESKIRGNTPFSLEGWAMRAICDTLREYGVTIKKKPGPKPKK